LQKKSGSQTLTFCFPSSCCCQRATTPNDKAELENKKANSLGRHHGAASTSSGAAELKATANKSRQLGNGTMVKGYNRITPKIVFKNDERLHTKTTPTTHLTASCCLPTLYQLHTSASISNDVSSTVLEHDIDKTPNNTSEHKNSNNSAHSKPL
jgi:hypothetical protein